MERSAQEVVNVSEETTTVTVATQMLTLISGSACVIHIIIIYTEHVQAKVNNKII